MRFKSATLKGYKRFTDLTVCNVPDTARLIVLVGPNGCGKSSLVDALWSWHLRNMSRGHDLTDDYHSKLRSHSTVQNDEADIVVDFHDSSPSRTSIYVRTAHRNDPAFQITELQHAGDPLDDIRVSRLIDNDEAVRKNYERLVAKVFAIFDSCPIMSNEFTESIIGPIRDPIRALFPDLVLHKLSDPLEDGTFRFTKGRSIGFPFQNLSGGEKAAFDLILDLVIAGAYFDDTVYCIDEPEAHINAKLQSELLTQLYDLIPPKCQLMIATHSIGMIRRAREIEASVPGTVTFLDFGNRDFDQPQVIEPVRPDRAFWKRAYKVALDDLANLVTPERVIICEGEPKAKDSGRNYSHDARCYQVIFEKEFPETEFVPGGSANEVETDKRGIAYVLGTLAEGIEVIRLIDRDARSGGEVRDLLQDGVRVLSRRNLEGYLFDDEVLEALARSVCMKDKIGELLAEKQVVVDGTQHTPDDLKRIRQAIYVLCTKKLRLTNPGNDTHTFLRDTLAPLVKPGMTVYEELKHDIFGAR